MLKSLDNVQAIPKKSNPEAPIRSAPTEATRPSCWLVACDVRRLGKQGECSFNLLEMVRNQQLKALEVVKFDQRRCARLPRS